VEGFWVVLLAGPSITAFTFIFCLGFDVTLGASVVSSCSVSGVVEVVVVEMLVVEVVVGELVVVVEVVVVGVVVGEAVCVSS